MSLIRRGAATFGFSIDAAARRRLPRIVVAAMAMGGALWPMARWLPASDADVRGLAQAVILLALIAAAIAVYGLLLAFSGALRWQDAVNAIRQAKPTDLHD